QLFDDVGVARRSKEGREPIEPGDEAVLDLARRHLARPANDPGYTEAAFHHRALALREWRLSAVGPSEDFGPVVGGEHDDGIFVDAQALELLHQPTDNFAELRL